VLRVEAALHDAHERRRNLALGQAAVELAREPRKVLQELGEEAEVVLEGSVRPSQLLDLLSCRGPRGALVPIGTRTPAVIARPRKKATNWDALLPPASTGTSSRELLSNVCAARDPATRSLIVHRPAAATRARRLSSEKRPLRRGEGVV
jgi:hypothetical protein